MKVLRRLPILIAIPTTAGTGSETTLAAVITDPAAHHKYALMSFPLIPHYAVLDATFTYSLPPQLTATTGMDALTHAAYKAGISFSKSYVGYIHAVAHSLGGKYGTPHGLANAVIVPYVLEAYGERAYKKLHRLGIAAGVCTKSDSYEAGAKKFIGAIKELNAKMGIPNKLPDIEEEDIPQMAKFAEKEANPLYPVPVLMTRKELEKFYYQIADWSK